MIVNKAFLHYISPKLCSTYVLLASLWIYSSSKNQRTLLVLGVLLGLLTQTLLTCFHHSLTPYMIRHQATVHLAYSVILLVCTTILGFDMVKSSKKTSVLIRSALFFTPVVFILNQGIDIDLYLSRNTRLTPSTALFTFFTSASICSLLSLSFYAAVYFSSETTQRCIYSTVLYFSGAVALSNVFGYMEVFNHPVIKRGLVYTLRQSQRTSVGAVRRLINAAMGIKEDEATNWIGTGYSLYWFLVSFGLMYKHKNK